MFAPLVARSSRKQEPRRQPAPSPPLRLGPVDGPLEREADRTAASIAGGVGPEPGAAPRISLAPVAARAGAADRAAAVGSASGEALPPEERRFFDSRFERDFSAVRVHHDGRAGRLARALGARAYTCGSDIVFGAGEYAPGSQMTRALLAHELSHVVQQAGRPGLVQRSPLSDSVKAAWAADPKIEALLARLAQPDIQAAQGDGDIDAELTRILVDRPDDLWVADRIRKGELGRSTGQFGPKEGGKPVARPVKAFFFRGSTDRRALVIAGVHGSERQGMEVVEMLKTDLAKQPPAFTTIVVPSLFPDSKARGDALAKAGAMGRMDEARESGPSDTSTPTNRNFPDPSQDLAAAKAAGKGKAIDKMGRAILPENQMLMELMERFRPERIISVHGTKGPGSAGVFYDKRNLRADEEQAALDSAAERSVVRSSPSWEGEGGAEARSTEIREALYKQRIAEKLAEAEQTDRDLSLKAAAEIDKQTAAIGGRDKRSFGREKESEATIKANRELRKKHPSVGGNVGPTGALDNATWSGSSPGGISLGGYAPKRGMSVFTVEPPLNYRSDDPVKLEKMDEADRKLELKAYADAIRTILLGTP